MFSSPGIYLSVCKISGRFGSRSRSVKLHVGIKQPGLICCGSRSQRRKFSGVFGDAPAPTSRGSSNASGPAVLPLRRRAADRVTIDARLAKESLATRAHVRGSSIGRLLLVASQCSNSSRRCDDDPDQHVGVLGAAVLGALAEIGAGLGRLEPHVFSRWDQIGFAGQPGHPEAVATSADCSLRK